jgi:hypothetical protein
MTQPAAPGSSESAARSAPVLAGGTLGGGARIRIAGSLGAGAGAGAAGMAGIAGVAGTGGLAGVGLLRVVGLLLGLLLVSAGCGPPS